MLFQKELTQDQRLQRGHSDLINSDRYKYMAPTLLVGVTKLMSKEEIRTAMTDGVNIVYSGTFLATLNEAEVRGVIVHENMHKEGRHLIIYAYLWKIDPELANLSCDGYINVTIHDTNPRGECIGGVVYPDGFAAVPKIGYLDFRLRGMSVPEIFEKLYEEKHGGGEDEGEGEGEGQGQGEGEGEGEGQGEGEGDEGDGPPTTPSSSGETFDEHDWESIQEMTGEEQREVCDKIENALREGAILAGKTGGDVSTSLQELLTPKVDWVASMAAFARERCVGKDYGTFSKPNRRYMDSGIIMPTSVSETIPELLVSMDTSGSCWDALPYFLGELKAICATLQPHVLHVMFWDTNVVYEKYTYNQIDGLEIKEAYGGGGTDVNCVTTYMREHKIRPTAAIVMTDGYLSDGWGKWSCPVFWALVNNPSAIPPVGKYVHVEEL